MYALSCIRGNKLFEFELAVRLQPRLQSWERSYAGRTENSDVWLNVATPNNEKDSTIELYQVFVKGCNRLFVAIT